VPVLGLALALAASLALNGAFVIQHAGSARAPEVRLRHPIRAVRGLLAQPTWTAGLMLGMVGWALHIAALAHAPLSLVQAVVASGLAIVAPLSALIGGTPMRPRELAATAGMIVGLVALFAGLHVRGAHGRFAPAGLASYLLVSAAAAGVLVRCGGDRAEALGGAAGLLYGAADVAIKAITGVAARRGWIVALVSPSTVAALSLTAVAFLTFQRALQRGRPVPVIGLMTTASNVLSVLGGLIVFGDPLGRRPPLVALHALGFLTIVISAWALAPVRLSAPRPTGQPGGV
jgi:hypothetical protein